MAAVIITTILPLSVFAQSEKAVAPAKTDSVKKLAQQIQNPANDPFNYGSNTLKSTENYPSAFDLRNVDTNGDGKDDKKRCGREERKARDRDHCGLLHPCRDRTLSLYQKRHAGLSVLPRSVCIP